MYPMMPGGLPLGMPMGPGVPMAPPSVPLTPIAPAPKPRKKKSERGYKGGKVRGKGK